MKTTSICTTGFKSGVLLAILGALSLSISASAAPATVLFEDDFLYAEGWTSVQPPASYTDGPLLWQWDLVNQAFVEQSNIYTGPAAASATRIAPMLINDAACPNAFTYTARLTAGDDDGFGLIFGYQDHSTFYRVFFGRQPRTGWPFTGWGVDRMQEGAVTDLFGAGIPGYFQTFVNTRSQPFDVTITVAGNNLTLTVVDDPNGAAIVHNLVENEPLPGPAGGQVGIFTWGQQGLPPPRSFQIQNLALSPTPLIGDLNQILATWTPVVPPRSDGTTDMSSGGPPNWSITWDANGPRNSLIENSDNFHTPDNTADGTVHFVAPSIVAGDTTWSNYVYSARFVSYDNDGFGLLLRYKDETNFYRVALRSQNSTSGVKQGLSIQKSVNQVFDEIVWDRFTLQQPPMNVPIDVHASIRDNRLQVVVVVNPEVDPQAFGYGPYDITDGTVDTGKIGVFSWAQFQEPGRVMLGGTEVHSVKVYSVDGEALAVSSPFGNPTPETGLHDLPPGSSVTASVTSPFLDAPGVRRVSTGWTGFGSVPASGGDTSVTFDLDSFSFLTWNWITEYQLSVSATTGGQVIKPSEEWLQPGTPVTVIATPDPGHIFLGWSGGSASANSTLNFDLNSPVTLTAIFAEDSDGDGLPDAWEQKYFGNLSSGADDDPDEDGVTNIDEFRRGTNPTFAEVQVATDGLGSQWINTQRDPALPGQLIVADFGPGYRGAWENSNHHRFGNDETFIGPGFFADFASFQSPIVVVREDLWDESWGTDFSASMEMTVGDNDGNCFYFRYTDEDNWYRVTLCGEETVNTARPRLGLSVQSRVNGVYTDLPFFESGPNFAAWTDPLDGTDHPDRPANTPKGFKRVRVTVNAVNQDFEVRVMGWDAHALPPAFNPSYELIATFSDASHSSGRIGFGFWGQGGLSGAIPDSSVNDIPVPSGAMADNIQVMVNDTGVFGEDWETAPLPGQWPAGWSNPYAGAGGPPTIEGNWVVTAHGTIAQLSNYGNATGGTLFAPQADVDGTILLGPAPGVPNYFLELGIHPFDDDGVGFVYDYLDTDNFARVLFTSQPSGAGRIPQGLTISRKSGGEWSDMIIGDPTFVYVPGRPMEVHFANNNGEYHMTVRDVDTEETYRWQWTDAPARPDNRFGITTWASVNAHFLHARAFSLPTEAAPPTLSFSSAAVVGGNIILGISNPGGVAYDVLRATVLGGSWTTVASNQTSSEYSEPLGTGIAFYRLQIATP